MAKTTRAIVPADPTAAALMRLDSRALPQYLTREQVLQLVAATRTDRDRLFVRVAFETGGRVSELVELRRADVDLTNRQIRLRTLKRRNDRRRKRPEVFRWIPVSHSLCADVGVFMIEQSKPSKIWTLAEVVGRQKKAAEYLRRLHRAAHAAKISALSPEEYAKHRGLPLTAPREIGNARLFPFTRQRAHKIFQQAGKRAGLVARGGREISPHILRHSFAMNCLTQGVPITILKDLLGHASIVSTMVYLKTDPAQEREFLSKVQF